jgi:hypothetical protein
MIQWLKKLFGVFSGTFSSRPQVGNTKRRRKNSPGKTKAKKKSPRPKRRASKTRDDQLDRLRRNQTP